MAGAIEAWHVGHGFASCRACQHQLALNDWIWEPAWGFGYLGFEFWNWPTITDSFVETLSNRLGHRIVVVRGKL
jgi:hypothetical protein